jgi:hypothetical protein
LVGLELLTPGQVWAATQTKGGISISPFLQDVSIAPSDGAKSFELQLTNHTSSLQEIKLSARDFGSLNDTGGILLEGTKKYTQKYGLASWLVLAADTVVLQPGESRSVTVTIDNRSSLQPGGHYGAVAAAVTSLDESPDNHVAINQQLLSLLLVNKVGGEKYDLKLVGLEQNGNWLHLPSTIKLRFQNPGNVHVIPRGEVKLKSPSGKVVARGVINSESAFVLPETFRELYVPLAKVNDSLPFPGLYRLEVDYRYEGINRVASRNYPLRFVSLGTYLVVGLLLLSFVVFFRRRRKVAKSSTSTK